MNRNSVTRFSDRVDDYIKYRPGYPEAVLNFLRVAVGLGVSDVIADVGSGTGIFSELFLKNGNTVFGVEPNAEMRRAVEKSLSSYKNFLSIDGTAESTTLDDGSVDFITAAQAFHWFDPQKAKTEFIRILRPQGKVVLVWNARRPNGSEFLLEYEFLVTNYGTDYCAVRHKILKENGTIAKFFGSTEPLTFSCSNNQILDFDGLAGRLLSSSYAPKPGHPKHEPMIEELKKVFNKHERNGTVRLEYETEVTVGGLE